ncbi:replication initiation and membrane attachment family protein [Oikeobacillus pervagus]|nr:replication initiation and membrane attachment family protein [Oikeobacillus pervagus]
MKMFWNEIQPADQYVVRANGILNESDRKIITFLYQPLIGSTCFSLYMTLWAEVEENRLYSQASTHYHLMNFLDRNLQEIFQERLNLEGIGLLKTYMRKQGDLRQFIYELQPPLSPAQFFNDGMLNIFLYRKIGHAHFTRLKHFFSDEWIDHEVYQDITKSFQEVFSSSEQTIDYEALSGSKTMDGKEFIDRKESAGLPLSDQFDFDLLQSGLASTMIPKNVLTPAVKETIVKLSHLYGINELNMKNIILTSVDEHDRIDIEVLRKSARDWFQLETGKDLPKLVHLSSLTTSHDEKKKEPLTKEEQLIQYLEETSPRQVLTDISEAMPSNADMQAVEEVMFQQNLPPGVVNVLIQYVMLKTDMKLSKAYMEKIASHWSRKKIRTVKGAMDLAKKEHRNYLDWANKKQENNKKSRKKAIRTEKLPDWFHEDQQETTVNQQKEVDHNFEEEKRQLQEQLRKRSNPGGETN